MYSFVLTLTVVVAAIAVAMAVALRDPDQPATLRRQPGPAWARRLRPRVPRRTPRPVERLRPVAVGEPLDVEAGGLTDQWVTGAGISAWVRVRSGVVLTVLLAVVGALVAASIAGVVLFLAIAVRDAVS